MKLVNYLVHRASSSGSLTAHVAAGSADHVVLVLVLASVIVPASVLIVGMIILLIVVTLLVFKSKHHIKQRPYPHTTVKLMAIT